MIYFIQAGENGPIKIGFTKKPLDERLYALQSANPEQLTILLTVADGSREMERRLHRHFKSDRIRREWFRPSEELLGWISCPTEIPVDASPVAKLRLIREHKSSPMGDRLLWARSSVQLSRDDLDELAGLSSTTIYRIETQARMPNSMAVLRIARTLGVTFEWIIGGEGVPPTPEQIAVAVVRAREAHKAAALKPTGTDGEG